VPASKKRIGVIGVGFGAQVHVPGLQSEGWEVAALCSRNRDKATQIAQAAGVRDVHTDARELIRRDDLDAVAITTPPGAHCELAVAALSAGKHVLCEKPFALDAKEAAVMRDAAEASGRTAMICHEFRHTPQRGYIKQLLGDGYIGKFQLCTIELFLDRYVTPQPRALTWNAYQRARRRIARRARLALHRRPSLLVRRDRLGVRPARSAAAGRARSRNEPDRQSRDRRHVPVHAAIRERRLATMTSSFAATPTRGARIVVMGERGTLIAEQPGPNPMEDGIVIGSRDGSPLQPLETPKQYLPFKDARDHR
jgi:predicted dehydrogenase